MISRSVTGSRLWLSAAARTCTATQLPARGSLNAIALARSFSSHTARYAEKPSAPPPVPATEPLKKVSPIARPGPEPKKRSWSFWKALWRLSYGSALATAAVTAYMIYDTRHPKDQQPADPKKKTIVILGTGWGSVSLLKKIDASNYNIIVVSPRNFFLFTPLLPSCTTGTVEHRSIMEPVRNIIRSKETAVTYYEAEATKIDYDAHKVVIEDAVNKTQKTLDYDYLVVGVGAQNSTFGIPGVQEHACFLKEIPDAQKIRKQIMDCIETASFMDPEDPERKRYLHTVVVGGGPTGVEFAAELQDFFEEDLKKWIPQIAKDFKVTLVEALPNVLPSFSKQLIEYTEKTMKAEQITVLTKTMVKKVDDKIITAEGTKPDGTKEVIELPYGLLVWATGNAARPVVRDVLAHVESQQNSRRGLLVNEYLVVEGTSDVWALGDCTATKYAPTAQVAAQQGVYLAGLFGQLAKSEDIREEISKLDSLAKAATSDPDRKAILAELESKARKLRRTESLLPFEYSHQGSLAYIGSDRAVADLTFWGDTNNFSTGGQLTYLFWRSAYISMVFSVRNRLLVIMDWLKVKTFGRDVSRE